MGFGPERLTECEQLNPVRLKPPFSALPHCFQSKLTNYLQLKCLALYSLLGLNPAPGSPLHPGWVWKGAWPVKWKSVNGCSRAGRALRKPTVQFTSWQWPQQPGPLALPACRVAVWSRDMGPGGACEVGSRGHLWR